MKISAAGGNTQTNNSGDRYDGQAQDVIDVADGWSCSRQAEEHAGRSVDTLISLHTHMTHSLFLSTFLQALMDEAMVLSTLAASTSTDSEPSNMADDWKLLRSKKGTESSLSEQVLVKHATPLVGDKDRSYWGGPLLLTIVHTVLLQLPCYEFIREPVSGGRI